MRGRLASWRAAGGPPPEADPARRAREEKQRLARVAFAYELAPALHKVFPREVVIQIRLWGFWG